MSRTTLLLFGFAAMLLLGVFTIAGLLLGRSFLTITDRTGTAPTPLVSVTLLPAATLTANGPLPTATPTAGQAVTAVASPTTALTPVTSLPTATTLPPTAVSVVNTSVQYVLALSDVNIRSGPALTYPVIGSVAGGQMAGVTGVSSDHNWWRVTCPDGSAGNCWVTAGSQYTQPTTAPTGCTNSATWVADVSVPDGSTFAPNTGFNKIWRLQNSGTCAWDSSYSLIHAGGHLLGAVATAFPLRDTVLPGQTVDLTLNLVSPAAPGSYQSDWKLQDAQGRTFGLGGSNSPIWVKIVVSAAPNVTLAGLIYQDWNQNGVYDSGETLVGGREVRLVAGTACHVQQEPVAVAFSGADGRYTFKGSYSGSYCLGVVGNGGLDDVASVTVTAGQVLDNIHLQTPAPSGSITGFLWDDYCLTNENGDALDGDCVADANGDYHADGMLQPTEGMIAGVTILLQAGPCGTDNSVAVSAVTDATGKYVFGSLLPGTYCVFMNAAESGNAARLLPGDWTFPARGIWYQEITLQAGDSAYPVNFGWDYQLR